MAAEKITVGIYSYRKPGAQAFGPETAEHAAAQAARHAAEHVAVERARAAATEHDGNAFRVC